MKRLLSLLIFFIVCSANAQIAPDKYFVEFTDKNGTPFSTDHPEQFLSARSIDRRLRQSVVTTEQDLPVNPAYVNAVAATGVTVLNRTKWFNGVTIHTTDPSALVAISALPFVRQVRKYQGVKNHKTYSGEEKFNFEKALTIPGQKGHFQALNASGTYNYGRGYNQIHMLHGDSLHNMGYRGQGMVIAVLDAGFLLVDSLPVFDSLRLNNRILGTRDFVLPGNDVYREYPHGMSVLSTMGGNLPGELVGTAPEAAYWLFRTEDAYSENYIEEYNWVSGAEAADSVGADVINSSLGYTTFEDPMWDHTYADLNGHTALATKGANIAASKGIAVVNSAGNEGSKPWRYISVPSDGDAVLAIGAVDSLGSYAGFSSHGIPGNNIKPNVVSQGQFSAVAASDSTIIYSSGTSFSSPIMAGMVACLWQSRPELSVAQLFRAIEMSASHFSNPDTLTGYGIPNFPVALAHLGYSTTSIPGSLVYPNPFTREISIRCFSPEEERADVVLLNEMGQVVCRQEFTLHPGENRFTLNTGDNLPAGLFILSLRSKQISENYRLVKIVK